MEHRYFEIPAGQAFTCLAEMFAGLLFLLLHEAIDALCRRFEWVFLGLPLKKLALAARNQQTLHAGRSIKITGTDKQRSTKQKRDHSRQDFQTKIFGYYAHNAHNAHNA